MNISLRFGAWALIAVSIMTAFIIYHHYRSLGVLLDAILGPGRDMGDVAPAEYVTPLGRVEAPGVTYTPLGPPGWSPFPPDQPAPPNPVPWAPPGMPWSESIH